MNNEVHKDTPPRPYRTDASLHIALFVPTLSGGGAERNTVVLANALAGLGHAVDLVVADSDGPARQLLGADVNLIDLRKRRALLCIWPLAKYLHKARPSILITAINYANVCAIASSVIAGAHVPVVVTERNSTLTLQSNPLLVRRFLPLLMRQAYKRASAIVCVSQGVATSLAALLHRDPKGIDVIYNPVVSTVETKDESPPHAWLSPQSPPVIIAVGRLHPAKDHRMLLNAVARTRSQIDCRLIILGEGPLRHELELAARTLGIHEHALFPGFVPDPRRWIRHAKVFALSSRWEGLPTVLIEALSCNLHVVSTDCPHGPMEILEAGRWGALVPVGDHIAMSESLIAALRSPSRPVTSPRALDFTVGRAAERYMDLIKRILSTHAQQR